ncbi:MAG TPA: nitroreductase [Chloroflexi bacterium]|nr:nitroreductase [Chloroflexota bacterium]
MINDLTYGQPITEIIQARYSCRNYADRAIEEEKQERLRAFIAANSIGPFGTPARFKLVTAAERDREELRGLGTYGFIKGATGFIIGAVEESGRGLEDFGYLMEQIILFATDLGLGTCWLGGSFNKSNFSARISARETETVPAVTSIGYAAEKPRLLGRLIRRQANSDRRKPWEELFFLQEFGAPLSHEAAGPYAVPLDMVRLGPSASNKQPWRIVKDGAAWHLYLQRTKGYRDRNWGILRIADMQRIDIGIAMCHLELAARELGLPGDWQDQDPAIELPDTLTEYTVSWVAG